MATLNRRPTASQGTPVWEAGDCLSVYRTSEPTHLRVPLGLAQGEVELAELTTADETRLEFRLDGTTGELVVPELPRICGTGPAELLLEYTASGRFRLVTETAPELSADTSTIEGNLHVELAAAEDAERLTGGRGGYAGLLDFQLAQRAARIGTHGGFDQLICLPLVREMDLLDHQIRTATTVLQRFRGRAMLCDEVGLGKTIEAGLVLAELHLRGLVRSVLVLVPPSLIEQWLGELRRKFALDFITHDSPDFRALGAEAWTHFDHVIGSTHTAKREPHRSAILAREWDLVIVDEAHHLRNRTTQLWKLASGLRSQYLLLLTATPVQNNLDELFNLVTLLAPGLLRTAKQFQSRFVDRRDKLMPRHLDELHSLLAEVMVRNRRSTVGLQFTRRWARTLAVEPSPLERELYRAVTTFVKDHLRGPTVEGGVAPDGSASRRRGGLNQMALIALQMALGSSCRAAAGTLSTLAENPRLDQPSRQRLSEFSALARRETAGAKVDRLRELLSEFPDKIVIFTQFRATQAMLADELTDAGESVAMFHGGLSRLEKEAAIDEFRHDARILLCTEAGSEGRNLQFAHAVCNFDLPWNPMKIEQRIGRLSRIGQSHDVQVYNLVASGTVEEAILRLLDAKLSMFELVIGEIDMVLGNLEDDREFQDVVAELWTSSRDDDDFARRMDDLGERLLAAKASYLQQRAHDDRLFGSRFAPEG